MDNPEIFEIPSAPFTYNGKTVQLHGLSLAHIIHIVNAHREPLSNLFLKAAQGQLQSDPQSIALELAEDFEHIVGRIIACSMHRPEAAEQMRRLPITAQIEAMSLIVGLTLAQDGGLEKTLGIVTQALVRANEGLFRQT